MRLLSEILEGVQVVNTGKPYSAGGQRVGWAVIDFPSDRRSVVAFYDHDRGLEGTIVFLGEVTERKVLKAYEACSYDHAGLDKLGSDGKMIRAFLKCAVMDSIIKG